MQTHYSPETDCLWLEDIGPVRADATARAPGLFASYSRRTGDVLHVAIRQAVFRLGPPECWQDNPAPHVARWLRTVSSDVHRDVTAALERVTA